MLKIIMFSLKGKGKPSNDFGSERFNTEVELGDKKRLNTKNLAMRLWGEKEKVIQQHK